MYILGQKYIKQAQSDLGPGREIEAYQTGGDWKHMGQIAMMGED
jgi:hypothetical protein